MEKYGENEAQGKFWNEKPGQAWVKNDALMNERLAAVSEILFDNMDVAAGMAGLDIGCGAGATTRRLAKLVGVSGQVTGVDISQPLIDLACSHLSSDEAKHIRFMQADVQSHAFTPQHYDRAISRFGVMFFEQPVRAFANIKSALKPAGQCQFVCWAPLEKNDFFRVPLEIAKKHIDVELPEIGREPGPLAFSDKDYLSSILKDAGFSAHHIQSCEVTISTTDTVAENASLLMQIGMASRAIKEGNPSDDVLKQLKQEIENDSLQRMKNGRIEYGGTVYKVVATV